MKKLTITLSAVLCAGMLFGATDEIGSAVARTFAGRTAVITGAASGMGLCTARTLAEAGATVFMCDINGEGVEKAAAEINSWGKRLSGSDPNGGVRVVGLREIMV